MLNVRVLLSAVSALALATVAPASAQAPVTPETWTHTRSDLRPDPGVRFGTLPNGMKYAVMRNRTPPGEASVRLRIDAGSLSETEAQRGVAHFLEHMAFNGSKSVPEGEMVKILERAGLAFGPDTNAYTGFTETVYQLDLPEVDAKTLDTGLFLMRELAGNLLLDPKAIDRERGVILSEERSRDTPGSRVYERRLEFILKDQLPPDRLPIGETAVIRTAPASAFTDFYRRHYRPDEATLIVVGDIDPAAMEALIKAKFDDWRPAAGAPTEPMLGPVAPRTPGETELVVEPGVGSTTLQMSWVGPPDLAPDTRAERIADTPEQIAFAVLNRRLERLAQAENPPFIGASGGRGNEYDAAEVATLSVTARPDAWRPALAAVEQEQRRLLRHGVLQTEVDREIAEYRAALTARVAAAATRRNPSLASGLVNAVDADYVFTSPRTDLEVFEQAVKGLTADRVSAAAREAFSGQGPIVFMASSEAVEGGEQAVAAAFAGSARVAVAAPVAEQIKPWPYADWGTSGQVAEQRRVEDMDATFVRFANGVRLTVKPTDFVDDEVLVSVRVGGGRVDLPADRETVDWAAGFALTAGGTVELTNEEIERTLSGKVLGASFGIDDEAFAFSGRTRPQDFATQMELLTAYAVKPGFRPEPFARVKAVGATLHEQYEATPNGVLSRDLGALLRDGDPRWTFPAREAIAAASVEDLRALLAGPLATGAVEVVIVGDVTVDEAIAQTARTFGALPARPAAPARPAPERLDVDFPRPAAAPVTRIHRGRADQAIGYTAWPTEDFFSDPQRSRALRMLESVMDLRLTDELRETQGATYSPFTGYAASFVYPGYGYLAAGVEMPPDRLPGFYADVREIAADLRAEPPSADELDRARRPRIEALQRAKATNGYWLGGLAGAQTDPRRLDALRQSVPGLEKVTPADVQAAARRYLTDDKSWSLSVTPAAVPGTTAAR